MRKEILRKVGNNILPGILVLGIFFSCKENAAEENSVASELAEHKKVSENATPPVVEVIAADYAFGMPSEVPSGWVTFRMKNMGQEAHNAIIYKYSDSLTYQDLAAIVGDALKNDEITNWEHQFNSEIENPMGGPAILSPGLHGETTVFLEPGVYALTCWMVAEDGKYHVEKGMTRPFVVTEESRGATKPQGTVDVSLENLAINIEDSIAPGENIFNVKFKTMENVHLAKLAEGQEMADLEQWMNKVQNPSPFIFLGGAEQAPVGQSSTFKATLEPGRYALVTYGVAINGMSQEFVIPENGAAAPVLNRPVNPPVILQLGSGTIQVKGELKEGRTPVTIKNTGEKGFYILSRVKPGATLQDLKKYTEDAYVYERIDIREHTPPFYDIWQGPLEVGEEKRLNLEIKDADYVLTGPIFPGPLKDQWRGDEMFNVFGPGRK